MSMAWFRRMQLWHKKKRTAVKEKVVVQGCTLGFQESTVQGNVHMISGESPYCFVDDKAIYSGSPQFQIDAGAVSNGCELMVDYVGVIKPSAEYCLTDKDKKEYPLRDVDKKYVVTPGQGVAFPHAACVFQATVKVVNANQDNTEMA